MQSLPALTAEMRDLGIKTLTIELEPRGQVALRPPDDRDTEQPPPERDPDKPLDLCAAHGCTKRKGGVFGSATEFCPDHALLTAGVQP